MEQLTRAECGKRAEVEEKAGVNPHWLAFFKEVRRLAGLARQREAAKAAEVSASAKEKAPVGAEAGSIPLGKETEKNQNDYSQSCD